MYHTYFSYTYFVELGPGAELIYCVKGARLMMTVELWVELAVLSLLLWILIGGSWFYRRRRAAHQAQTGPACGACGYPTEGITGPTCPECGVRYGDVPVHHPGRRRGPGSLATSLAWCALAPVPLVLLYVHLSEYGLPRRVPVGQPTTFYVHPWWGVAVLLALLLILFATGLFYAVRLGRR